MHRNRIFVTYDTYFILDLLHTVFFYIFFKTELIRSRDVNYAIFSNSVKHIIACKTITPVSKIYSNNRTEQHLIMFIEKKKIFVNLWPN